MTLDVVECTSCRLVGRNGTLSVVDRMKAAKTVEEELRPDLPTTIPAYATLTLQAQELMDQSSEVYAGIVGRLADGDTTASIARLTGLPIQLIRKIRELHPVFIEAGRRAANARIEEALHASAQRLADNVDKIPLRQLPIALGILVDKAQLLTGGPTARVEHKHVPTKEELDAFFNSIPSAKEVS